MHPHIEEFLHFRHSPRASTRTAAADIGIGDHSAVGHILRNCHFLPYHFQKVQVLIPEDYSL